MNKEEIAMHKAYKIIHNAKYINTISVKEIEEIVKVLYENNEKINEKLKNDYIPVSYIKEEMEKTNKRLETETDPLTRDFLNDKFAVLTDLI